MQTIFKTRANMLSSMKGTILVIVMCSLVLCTMAQEAEKPLVGHWDCVALDRSHLALSGEYSDYLHEAFEKHYKELMKGVKTKTYYWIHEAKYRASISKAILSYRPALVKQLQTMAAYKITSDSGTHCAVQGLGYWLNSIGMPHFKDYRGKAPMNLNAEVVHTVFLTLSRSMSEGEHLTIQLPTGQELSFVYSCKTPNPLFKINQVGYSPSARGKYAYIGAWQGTGGPLPLGQYFGKSYTLHDAKTNEVKFIGKITKRFDDLTTDDGVPFTGEKVGELDFSSVSEPGTYYLAAEGLGRSFDFSISEEGVAESFYIHARGLYHKRCTIAKVEPYTRWLCPACHQTVYRGTFPPYESHYGKGVEGRKYGFFNDKGERVGVNPFQLIKENIPEHPEPLHLTGGWHDAADCDRRPFHLSIVGDLCAVFLMKPQNFIDGQLNIPESCNGLPDILDEARWGLEHLRQGQQTDGGVGTWIETTRHPSNEDGLPSEETLTYYLSCATRESTLEYAAYAALLSLALSKAGDQAGADLYKDSAKRAWDYALNPSNSHIRHYTITLDKQKVPVSYHENEDLPLEFLLKAGFNLSILFKDYAYQDPAEEVFDSKWKDMENSLWSRSPLLWAELEIFYHEGISVERMRQPYRRYIQIQANKMVNQAEKRYPYRTLWPGPQDGLCATMSWGSYHPFRRALMLLCAYEMTWNKNYLDAMWIGYDFHNGVNPLGRTMTSGLGRVYPVRFLDLTSFSDGIEEFVPGITPYGNTYGINWNDAKAVHGLFYGEFPSENFWGSKVSLLPHDGLSEKECREGIGRLWPIWRRCVCLENYSVQASEYTVWETIGPAAAVTGYLLSQPMKPKQEWLDRRPVEDIRKLPGYLALP